MWPWASPWWCLGLHTLISKSIEGDDCPGAVASGERSELGGEGGKSLLGYLVL